MTVLRAAPRGANLCRTAVAFAGVRPCRFDALGGVTTTATEPSPNAIGVGSCVSQSRRGVRARKAQRVYPLRSVDFFAEPLCKAADA
jgi:hypothetical protein